MVAIIVGTHGEFSREIVKSSEMIFGKQENIQYVTFNPGESADDLINKYESIMRELNYEDGLLFMVDLFGGSPYNAASRVAVKEEHIDIVTGVNLPMLLEVFAVRDSMSIKELVKVAETAGNMGIKSFKSNFVNIEEEL
ncbi:mannose/fructose/sorbose PTS transporter subunit IIA [Clostridium sp. YIM B02506]|uniref:PTS sugar transporter subunit IIA n=1 Tax=Clostridium sp. YIM B02506 TaxID=2910680 RepID=UPI001EEE11F3|nr:mannose/fructose/sorbose PTS transporter subunit IIA [Clostridium sp. YIM B02506]